MSDKCDGPKKSTSEDGLQKKDAIADATAKVLEGKAQVTTAFNRAIKNITQSSPNKQLVIGTATGWVSGVIAIRISRTAALAAGSSIILLKFAENKGLLEWKSVKEKAMNSKKWFDVKYGDRSNVWKTKVTTFTNANPFFTAGFVGGFLIGIAS